MSSLMHFDCVYSSSNYSFFFFFFTNTATTEIYTLSLHDALPISLRQRSTCRTCTQARSETSSMPVTAGSSWTLRSEEHTSELQSLRHLVCRLLLEKKKKIILTNLLLEVLKTRATSRIINLTSSDN